MNVIIMFLIEDEEVKQISAQDLHPQDLNDQINDVAIEEDRRCKVWHFTDTSRVGEVVTELWALTDEEVPSIKLIRRV